MWRTLLGSVLAVGVLAGAASCGDATLAPLPLQVSIQASRVISAPGDAIDFVVTAQGGDLLGVTIDYGDDGADFYGAGGARTARVTFSHAYAAAGRYEVRAKAVDALAGEREAEVEIRVQ